MERVGQWVSGRRSHFPTCSMRSCRSCTHLTPQLVHIQEAVVQEGLAGADVVQARRHRRQNEVAAA